MQKTLFTQKNRHTKTTEYLGILLDENLTFQFEKNYILKRMACVIKTLHLVTGLFPEKIKILLLNAFVENQIQSKSVLHKGIAQYYSRKTTEVRNKGIVRHY